MLKKLLKSSNKIAIFWHESIDGDSLWAMLALGKLLEKQWKKVKYFTPSQPSKIFNFLSDTKKIKTNFDYANYDLLIFIDFTWYNRIPQFTIWKENYFDKKNLIIIDHHPEDNIAKHAVVLKDIYAISTCEIMFEMTYKRRKKYYDKDIATYLFLGISTDSWHFKFDEDKESERIFSDALKLLKLWANKKSIINNIYRKKSLQAVKFMQTLLSRIIFRDKILYTYFTENELTKNKIDEEEAVYTQFIMQDIVWPEIIIVFKILRWFLKWSLRSNSIIWELRKKNKQVNCWHIAKIFWGGWHKTAAWFKLILEPDFKKQIEKTINKIKLELRS